MTENPYDSPAHTEPNVTAKRSLRRYATASMLVVANWLLATALLFWLGILTLANGNVSFAYTSQPFDSIPLGAPTISTHVFYLNTFAAVVLWGVLVALSLVVINGIVAIRRGRAVG